MASFGNNNDKKIAYLNISKKHFYSEIDEASWAKLRMEIVFELEIITTNLICDIDFNIKLLDLNIHSSSQKLVNGQSELSTVISFEQELLRKLEMILTACYNSLGPPEIFLQLKDAVSFSNETILSASVLSSSMQRIQRLYKTVSNLIQLHNNNIVNFVSPEKTP